jgi:hypothetical protein
MSRSTLTSTRRKRLAAAALAAALSLAPLAGTSPASTIWLSSGCYCDAYGYYWCKNEKGKWVSYGCRPCGTC